jgi:hypothetical protein
MKKTNHVTILNIWFGCKKSASAKELQPILA